MKIPVRFAILAYHMLVPAFSKVELDKEHLEIYPFCGKLFGYEWSDATSRIVNSFESDIQYPWVVYMEHKFMILDEDDGTERLFTRYCSGTVIGDK